MLVFAFKSDVHYENHIFQDWYVLCNYQCVDCGVMTNYYLEIILQNVNNTSTYNVTHNKRSLELFLFK